MGNELIVRDQTDKFSLLSEGQLSADQIAELMNFVAVVKEKAKELSQGFDAAIQAMLETMAGDKPELTVGTIRFYLGTKRKYKARNAAELVNEIILLSGGDMDAACTNFMSSDPFRHGAIREVLKDRPERFDELFETIELNEVKEGKPARGLQKADTRFVKSKPLTATAPAAIAE